MANSSASISSHPTRLTSGGPNRFRAIYSVSMTHRLFTLATIVEGFGEVAALPLLLRRLHPTWRIARPIRQNRWKIVKPDMLERAADMAVATVREHGGLGGVLVVLDAETDAACVLGPQLLERLNRHVGHLPNGVVLAVKQYEAWLIGGGSMPGAKEVPDPEGLPSPKRWIRERVGEYSPTADQPGWTEALDVDEAKRRCPSFDKLLRSLEAMRSAGGGK